MNPVSRNACTNVSVQCGRLNVAFFGQGEAFLKNWGELVVVGYHFKMRRGVSCFDFIFHALILNVIDIAVIFLLQKLTNNCLNLLARFRLNQSMASHKRPFGLQRLDIEAVLEMFARLVNLALVRVKVKLTLARNQSECLCQQSIRLSNRKKIISKKPNAETIF